MPNKIARDHLNNYQIIMDEQTQGQYMPPQNQIDPSSEQSDAEKNKVMAIVGYIIPILFFVPLVSDAKNSPYARFHAGQQLNILLLSVAFSVLSYIIAAIRLFFLIGIINLLAPIIIIALIVVGAINAANGQMKKLPVIGDIQILK